MKVRGIPLPHAIQSAKFDRPQTIMAITKMVEGLNDEDITTLWEWLRVKYGFYNKNQRRKYFARKKREQRDRDKLLK